MKPKTRFKILLAGMLWVCCLMLLCPMSGAAQKNGVQLQIEQAQPPSLKAPDLDFDQSDPVALKAPIMEIDYEKFQLVVAEEVIFVVDFMIGEHRFFTEVKDAEGNPHIFESFNEGDYVLVKGFKNADGVVLASLLQKAKKQRKRIRHKDNRSK